MGRSSAFVSCVKTIARLINRRQQCRSLATRDDKRAANYRALVVLAAIVIWLTT